MYAYDFRETVRILGEDCGYDPESGAALIYCMHCGQPNVVLVGLEDGRPVFMGFTCDKCMLFNAPE